MQGRKSCKLIGMLGPATALAACGGILGPAQVDDVEVQVEALLPANNHDVTEIEYMMQCVDCTNALVAIGPPLITKKGVEPQASGQGTSLVGFDSGGTAHAPELLRGIPPGCYQMTASPLAGGSASKDCAPTRTTMTVGHKRTVVSLQNHCRSSEPGHLEVVATFNRAPSMTDVSFGGDSTFTCGAPPQVCATATDPDGDPIELVLDVPECQVATVGEKAETRRCWQVTCYRVGKVTMTARVYDLIDNEAGTIRIEDWLRAHGNPISSHGQMEFFSNWIGLQEWPDSDADGHGDRGATAQVHCRGDDLTGLAPNHDDCNDNDATIYPGAPELCGDGKDNDCNGKIDDIPPCPSR